MIHNNHDKLFTVTHSIQNWLPITQTWIYNQLFYMKTVQSVVLTYRRQNLELFPWKLIIEAPYLENLIFRLIRKADLDLRRYAQIFDDAIKKYKPEIFHSHFGNRAWFDLPLVQDNDLKHVVTFYGFDVGQLPHKNSIWIRRYQELFAKADLFLCEGPFMAGSIEEMGCPSEKLVVHRLGIELERISYQPRKIHPGESIKILIAGSFREKKGIPYALEAVGLAKKKYPQIQVTIIGDATVEKRSKNEKQQILHVINRYNLESSVRLLGFQPKDILEKEAHQHHIFLSPSVVASDGDTEGGAPVSIIEMAASGMPVISTTHCDIPQVIEHSKSGFLAEERNSEELYSYLIWLIEHPEDWERITKNARRNVEDKFDVENQAQELIELYTNLL